MPAYLIDTCVILWAGLETARLSPFARKCLTAPETEIFVLAASASEIACAVQRKRVRLPEHWKPWFRKTLENNGWQCLPVTLDAFEEAYSLPEPFHADPMDRILVATARLHHLTLITGDGKILDYPHVKSRW